jgi:hypothetical protein
MKKTFILFVIGTLLTSSLSSCSVLGYAIGTEIDHGAAHDTVTIFHNIEDNCGQTARIIYRDSSIAVAKFRGYEDEPDFSYRQRFDNFLQTEASRYGTVTPSDSIVLTSDSSGMSSGKFHGFLPYAIKISGQTKYFRNYYHTGSDVFPWLIPGIILGPYPFLIAKLLRNHSREFNGIHFPQNPKTLSSTDIAFMIEENAVPLQSTLDFSSNGRRFSLTNSDFRNVIIMPHSASARWICLGIGAAIDVAAIAFAIGMRGFGKNWNFLGK